MKCVACDQTLRKHHDKNCGKHSDMVECVIAILHSSQRILKREGRYRTYLRQARDHLNSILGEEE